MEVKFSLGQIVTTPGALAAMVEAGQNPLGLLLRHARGDYGDVCADDWKLNDAAVTNGGRIFSAYKLATGVKVWIITTATDDEGKRESTCILLPADY